jgi:hypothetical protein
VTAAARFARLNAAAQRHWGEACSYIDGDGAQTECSAVVLEFVDDVGGFAVVGTLRDERKTALISAADIVARPKRGERLTLADGTEMELDEDATDDQGMWRAILIPYVPAPADFEAFKVSDGAGGFVNFQVAASGGWSDFQVTQ